jgi:hypothetical protein
MARQGPVVAYHAMTARTPEAAVPDPERAELTTPFVAG